MAEGFACAFEMLMIIMDLMYIAVVSSKFLPSVIVLVAESRDLLHIHADITLNRIRMLDQSKQAIPD
ncbi:hypothetical protein N7456_008307 [Penicillium angulare]|uniref:Uncharacterized protein n=1 Tax=Penicillium angulare TaxID=116970 RepID=A0A9W9FCH5_9EURO|nr:hypothetical protein N7456_008307 [Penicillium angulare]